MSLEHVTLLQRFYRSIFIQQENWPELLFPSGAYSKELILRQIDECFL